MITDKKIQKKKDGYAQILLKFNFDGVQGTVYVGTDGWDKDKYENREGWVSDTRRAYPPTGVTKGKQIRFAINGHLELTIEEWEFLNEAIEVAYNEVLVLNS